MGKEMLMQCNRSITASLLAIQISSYNESPSVFKGLVLSSALWFVVAGKINGWLTMWQAEQKALACSRRESQMKQRETDMNSS